MVKSEITDNVRHVDTQEIYTEADVLRTYSDDGNKTDVQLT